MLRNLSGSAVGFLVWLNTWGLVKTCFLFYCKNWDLTWFNQEMQGYTWMIEPIAMDFSGIPGWGSVKYPSGTCMNSALSSFGCCPSLASQTHIISYRYFSVKTVLSLAVLKCPCGRSSHYLVIIVDAIAIFVICIPNHLKLMVVAPPKGRHFWIFPDSISLLPWVEISGCLTVTRNR